MCTLRGLGQGSLSRLPALCTRAALHPPRDARFAAASPSPGSRRLPTCPRPSLPTVAHLPRLLVPLGMGPSVQSPASARECDLSVHPLLRVLLATSFASLTHPLAPFRIPLLRTCPSRFLPVPSGPPRSVSRQRLHSSLPVPPAPLSCTDASSCTPPPSCPSRRLLDLLPLHPPPCGIRRCLLLRSSASRSSRGVPWGVPSAFARRPLFRSLPYSGAAVDDDRQAACRPGPLPSRGYDLDLPVPARAVCGSACFVQCRCSACGRSRSVLRTRVSPADPLAARPEGAPTHTPGLPLPTLHAPCSTVHPLHRLLPPAPPLPAPLLPSSPPGQRPRPDRILSSTSSPVRG